MEQQKLKPPYATSGVADELLRLFQRINPSKIDTKFIVENDISTSNNAFAGVDFLKWLKIIDKEGHVDKEMANKLRLIGEDKENFVRNLITEAYANLFENINVEQAKREDIINYFVREHGLGTGAAKVATALFLHLCQKYTIPIEEKLKKKTHTGTKKHLKKDKKEIDSSKKKLENHKYDFSGGKLMILIRSEEGEIDKPLFVDTKEDVDKLYDGKLKEVLNAAKLLCFNEDETSEKELEEN